MIIFLEEFSTFMSRICNNVLAKVIVCGDFNTHFETSDKPSRDLQDVLIQYGLLQQVDEVTHNQGHMLDLVFANPAELTLKPNVDRDAVKTNNPFIKFDHYPIFFEFSCGNSCSLSSTHRPVTKQIKWRNTKNMDLNDFKLAITEKLSNDIMCNDTSSFEQKLCHFNVSLKQTIDSFAPVQSKMVKCEVQEPAWFDAEYRNERRVRRRLEKLWKRLGTPESHEQFVAQRDHCVYLASTKERNYIRNAIDSSCN